MIFSVVAFAQTRANRVLANLAKSERGYGEHRGSNRGLHILWISR
jgi:hypothetical protein